MIRNIIAAFRKPKPIPERTHCAIAFAKVRSKDDNSAIKRAIIAQNRADLRAILSTRKSQ
jgi:hypothetical protein